MKKFWLVYNPSVVTPPKFRHPSKSSAVTEASRLAALCTGEDFFVLTATEYYGTTKPTIVKTVLK